MKVDYAHKRLKEFVKPDMDRVALNSALFNAARDIVEEANRETKEAAELVRTMAKRDEKKRVETLNLDDIKILSKEERDVAAARYWTRLCWRER